MSFPPGTEMFQFPGFASAAYGFSGGYSLRSGLPHSEILGSKPARGSPRLFAACHVLHRLLAPRHPPDALAFLGPPQRQPHPCPARHGRRGRPARDGKKGRGRRRTIPATTHLQRAARLRGTAASIPMPDARPARRRKERRRAERATCRRPSTHDARRDRSSMPADGHLITTSRCPKNMRRRPRPTRAGGARTGCPLRAAGPGPGHDGRTSPTGKRGLVGLGRLERPTSRLSGVRSNQLSYRPERHPAGPRQPGGEARANPDLVTAGPTVRTVVAKGRADGGGRL